MSKINVAILCGGRSSEHEISCVSAGGILGAIDRNRYQPILIGITRTSGRWVLMPEDYPLAIVDGALPSVPEDAPEVNTDIHGFSVGGKSLNIDLVFPILHGPYGEDGTIQGFCEIANIPYVGSGVLASATAMDKSFAKSIFASHGMKVAEGIVVTAEKWESARATCEALVGVLTYPLFVKPARGGSSRGTSKVHNPSQLAAAITDAHRKFGQANLKNSINQTVGILNRDNPWQLGVALMRSGLQKTRNAPGGFVGYADLSNFAGPDQLSERVQRFFDRDGLLTFDMLVPHLAKAIGAPVGPVQLVQIKVIGL